MANAINKCQQNLPTQNTHEKLSCPIILTMTVRSVLQVSILNIMSIYLVLTFSIEKTATFFT